MSKFQIAKGLLEKLPNDYTEGKVYFIYDNANSKNLSIYADIDGVRRKIYDPSIDGLDAIESQLDELYVREDEFSDKVSHELDPIDGTIDWCDSIAADETAKTVWEGTSSETVEVITPDRFTGLTLLFYIKILIDHRVNLVWMNGSELEFSTLQASINTQTNTIIVYACGRSTMAYGVAGVDTSWTIEALPDGSTYELPAATISTLGGVKIGNGLSVESDGTLSSDLDYAASPTSGGNAVRTNGILYGEVDSTSTSTAFTATVTGLTELYHGAAVLLKNGVVTSASGFTINVNGLGAKPVYSNMAATTRETTLFNINYTLLLIYDEDRVDGGCWLNYRGYYSDANSIGYQLRTNSSTLPAQAKFYRYRLLFTSANGTHWVPANTSTSTSADTAKTPNSTTPIDPLGPISYYGTTTAVNANANVGSGYQWQQYAINLGYSFNATSAALTLDYPKPVYVKCHPLADGSATIDATTPYTQALPSTADGCIYIYLGRAYSATGVELVASHPVYWHDGTGIRLWTGAESIVANGSVTTDKLADGTVTSAKLGNSSVTTDKLAARAVTSTKLADGAVTWEKVSDDAVDGIRLVSLVATDSQADQAITALGFSHEKYTPAEMAVNTRFANGAFRLCWIHDTSLEVAPITFVGNLQTQAITVYAKGNSSMASGVLGVDTSWTITELPTDGDGVSY